MEQKKQERRPRITTRAQPNGKYHKMENYVPKVMLSIIDKDNVISKHELYFYGKDKLSLTEMYENGFVGDLEFPQPNGSIVVAEVEAAPAGTYGDLACGSVNNFDFRFNGSLYPVRMKMRVVKFSYKTEIS